MVNLIRIKGCYSSNINACIKIGLYGCGTLGLDFMNKYKELKFINGNASIFIILICYLL